MIGLDTNVLVRYILRDDADQADRARAAIRKTVESGEKLHVNEIVLCELVWVLRDAYDIPRSDVAATIESILDTAELHVEQREAVREAVARYRAGKGDFADHLIGLGNRDSGCETTLTFDRALRSSELFRVLA